MVKWAKFVVPMIWGREHHGRVRCLRKTLKCSREISDGSYSGRMPCTVIYPSKSVILSLILLIDYNNEQYFFL